MRWSEWLVNGVVRFLTGVVCRVDEAPLRSIPPRGPLILVANHTNFLEAPLVYVRVRPRPATGFAKAEWWDNPYIAWLFTLWGAIPLRRGEGDVEAFRQALRALEQGSIVAVSPEGTRSGSGSLLRAQPGTAMLALRSGAPGRPAASLKDAFGDRLYAMAARHRRPVTPHLPLEDTAHMHSGALR